MVKLPQRICHKKYFYPVAVFSFSFFLRLLYIFNFGLEIMIYDDPWYFLQIADNIIDGHGFRQGNVLAYPLPLYPYFLAGIMSIFGNNVEIIRVVQILLGSAMCSAVFFIGRISFSVRVGLIASMLCAIYPPLIHFSAQIWTEQLFMFLVISAILSLLLSQQKSSLAWRVVTGLLLGLSALTREVGVLLLAGFFLWFVLYYRSLVKAVRNWWPIGVSALLVILPWTVRNYIVLERFVPISTNGGINFYIGNNPEANGTYMWVLPPGAKWNVESPNSFYETQASSLGYKYGFEFIIQNPDKSLLLITRRLWYLFVPPLWRIDFSESIIETLTKLVWSAMYIPLFVFSLIFGLRLIRSEFKALSLFFISICMLTLPYLVAFGATRFRLPMIPFMAIIAALVVDKKLTLSRR